MWVLLTFTLFLLTPASTAAAIAHQETKTGTGSGTSVTTSASLTNAAHHLYLAAITVNDNFNVSAVSGMGLTWTKLKQQCGSQSKVGVALFYAIGTGGSNGTVTATIGSSSLNAVIAVSRYSGVDPSSPVGTARGENASGGNGVTCDSGSQNPNAYESLTTLLPNSWAYGAMGNRMLDDGVSVSNWLGHSNRANVNRGGPDPDEANLVVVDQLRASTRGCSQVARGRR